MNYRIAIVNSSSFGKHFPEHVHRLEKIGSVERVRVGGDAHGAELADDLRDFNIVISSVTPSLIKSFSIARRICYFSVGMALGLTT